jgi:hypothetical protein
MYEKWRQESINYMNIADYIHSSSPESWMTKAYYFIT